MQSVTTPIEGSSLVWTLGSLCQINRVPFDPALLNQHFPPPYTLETLLHALKAYGFKAEAKPVEVNDIVRLVFPCVVLVRAQEVPADQVVEVAAVEPNLVSALADALPCLSRKRLPLQYPRNR